MLTRLETLRLQIGCRQGYIEEADLAEPTTDWLELACKAEQRARLFPSGTGFFHSYHQQATALLLVAELIERGETITVEEIFQ